MVVEDVYIFEGKHKFIGHPCVFTWLGKRIPVVGGFLRRKLDGAVWQIYAIERHMVNRELRPGDPVGLVLNKEASPKKGDKFYVIGA